MGTLDTYGMLGNGTCAVFSLNYLAVHLIVADEAVFRVDTLDVIVLRHVCMWYCRGRIGCYNFSREWTGELGSNEGAYIRFSDPTNPQRVTVAVECRSDVMKSCAHPSGSVRARSESPIPNNSNLIVRSHPINLTPSSAEIWTLSSTAIQLSIYRPQLSKALRRALLDCGSVSSSNLLYSSHPPQPLIPVNTPSLYLK